jgi:chromosomal replication initiation ATPase DnaA
MDAQLAHMDGAAQPLPLQSSISEIISFKDIRASWLQVRDAACAEIGIKPDHLSSRVRTAPLALARHFVAYRIHLETKLSIAGIGRLFKRDHTSILHGIRRMRALEAELGGFQQLQDLVVRTWKERR